MMMMMMMMIRTMMMIMNDKDVDDKTRQAGSVLRPVCLSVCLSVCLATLVVDGHDGVAVAHLDAGADHPVHAVLHLRVPALQTKTDKTRQKRASSLVEVGVYVDKTDKG